MQALNKVLPVILMQLYHELVCFGDLFFFKDFIDKNQCFPF
jgi:hypothetical protein